MNFQQINQIVSVGSVDGIATTAGLVRLIGNSDVAIEWTQAFAVDKIDPKQWKTGRTVAFVDLAVNNQDQQMTVDFVQRIKGAGHNIIAIIDEHDAEEWKQVMGSWEGLEIIPVSQKTTEFSSSGSWLRSHAKSADDHTVLLLDAADQGDKFNFETRIGGLINKAIKSQIWNNSRRDYLARHFAVKLKADETIMGWIAEYEAILKTHEEIIAEKADLGNGIYEIDTQGKTIDMSSLASQLYRSGAKVLVMVGMAYDKELGQKVLKASFMTGDKSLDLHLAMVEAEVPAGGFTSKVNVDPEHKDAALEAVHNLITK